jgi:hypothetical protein
MNSSTSVLLSSHADLTHVDLLVLERDKGKMTDSHRTISFQIFGITPFDFDQTPMAVITFYTEINVNIYTAIFIVMIKKS